MPMRARCGPGAGTTCARRAGARFWGWAGGGWGCWGSGWPARWRSSSSRSMAGAARARPPWTGFAPSAGPTGSIHFCRPPPCPSTRLPLTPDTVDIMNRKTLSRLQPGAYVINVARGAHLVDEDLLALIDSGHIAGATLDVFRSEPLPADHAFWRHPRITVTPHISARTLRQESIAQIAHKITTLEQGGAVTGVVDPARGY